MTPLLPARRFSIPAVVLAALCAALTGCGARSSALPPAGAPASGSPASSVRHVRSIGTATYQDICPPPAPGHATCLAVMPLNRTLVHPPKSTASARRTSSLPSTSTPGCEPVYPCFGWWPPDLTTAYNLPTSASSGAGMTVAIVDAFDTSTAESDLAVYRAFMGLPECTTRNGCFKKVNARGQQGHYPASAVGTAWTVEVPLDLDAVSGVCPNCRIVLVEAESDLVSDLAVAAATAGRLGNIVSNSYFAPEVDPQPSPGEPPTTAYVSSYVRPGVLYVAGTGDYGYEASQWLGGPSDANSPFPAGIPTVVAVGGTILTNPVYPDPSGYSETAWPGSGGGCSTLFPKPIWQFAIACPNRMTADVAATADGIDIYDTMDFGGWAVMGGTSASTPIVASVYALAKDIDALSVASLYVRSDALNDITTGSSGTCRPSYFCNARAGYDGPTGNGSPNGVRAFRDLF